MLATVTPDAEAAYTENDFFGATMYWSNYGLADYQAILTRIGFRLVDTVSVGHGYAPEARMPTEQHPVILAQAGDVSARPRALPVGSPR